MEKRQKGDDFWFERQEKQVQFDLDETEQETEDLYIDDENLVTIEDVGKDDDDAGIEQIIARMGGLQAGDGNDKVEAEKPKQSGATFGANRTTNVDPKSDEKEQVGAGSADQGRRFPTFSLFDTISSPKRENSQINLDRAEQLRQARFLLDLKRRSDEYEKRRSTEQAERRKAAEESAKRAESSKKREADWSEYDNWDNDPAIDDFMNLQRRKRIEKLNRTLEESLEDPPRESLFRTN